MNNNISSLVPFISWRLCLCVFFKAPGGYIYIYLSTYQGTFIILKSSYFVAGNLRYPRGFCFLNGPSSYTEILILIMLRQANTICNNCIRSEQVSFFNTDDEVGAVAQTQLILDLNIFLPARVSKYRCISLYLQGDEMREGYPVWPTLCI